MKESAQPIPMMMFWVAMSIEFINQKESCLVHAGVLWFLQLLIVTFGCHVKAKTSGEHIQASSLFAHGANQHSGEGVTDRQRAALRCAPGGNSTLTFGDSPAADSFAGVTIGDHLFTDFGGPYSVG